MRVFIDVGGHYGETLEVVLAPRWGFDRIYSFEPSQACLRVLRGYRDPRLTIVPVGLSDWTGHTTLYGAGLLGGSVYADKHQYEEADAETIQLVRASDWLRDNTRATDEIFLKLNCEGSEADVLDDLFQSGLHHRIESAYVDFDVQKVPSQAYRRESLERQLRDHGIAYVTPEQLGLSGADGVAEWLARSPVPPRRAGSRVWFGLRLYRPPYVWATHVARRALPASVFRGLARRVGAAARRAR